MSALYVAQATATGGRDGHVETHDGILKFDLTIPKELGGAGKAGATNPEQLFACGYAACFASALGFVARMKKVQVKHIEVTAKVGIGPKPGGGFLLDADLQVRLPELARAEAEKLMHDAHQVCPYSNATRNNIDVRLNVLDS
jgi:Ohr subfamily peroxiredoxin